MKSWKNGGSMVLGWLERYTKTDMVYLAHGSFWLGIGQVVSSGAVFLTSIAFANLLAPDVFGFYKYILSIASLLSITTLSGMDSAVAQSVARGFEGTLVPGVMTKMKWGVLGTGLSLLVAIYYYTQGNFTLSIAFCTVGLFMPFAESFDMYNSFLVGKRLFQIQTYYNMVKKIIALVAIVGTLFLTHNLYIILFVYFISIVIPNLFLYYRTIKLHQKNNEVDPMAIGYGKHLSAIYIIGTVLEQIDKVLVFHYVGAADLAVYALAVAPTDQIKGLLKNLNSLAFPQFAKRTSDEIRKTIWRKLFILSVVVTLLVLLYIILAPYLFALFFPKYLASVHYSQILSISLVPVIAAGFIETILGSKKATKELYKYNLYSNLINTIILFPLVYYYGIWGAVISRMTTRFFIMGLGSILLKKIS